MTSYDHLTTDQLRAEFRRHWDYEAPAGHEDWACWDLADAIEARTGHLPDAPDREGTA